MIILFTNQCFPLMQMKDGACNITGDETSLSGRQTATREPQQKFVIFGEPWNIPFFSESCLESGSRRKKILIND